jgi:hypothetical protein
MLTFFWGCCRAIVEGADKYANIKEVCEKIDKLQKAEIEGVDMTKIEWWVGGMCLSKNLLSKIQS